VCSSDLMLVAMWLGSTAGGFIHRHIRRPTLIYVVAQAGVVASALFLLWSHTPADVSRFELSEAWTTWTGQTLWQLGNIAAVIGLPAFLMGFAYPVANALVQDAEASIGTRAGALYLANTAGAVAGSMITGFVFLPWLGTQTSMLVLATAAGLSIITVWLAGRHHEKPARVGLLASLAATCIALGSWSSIDDGEILARFSAPLMNPDEKVLTSSEGLYETISVTESASGSRRLNTNGHSMSATTPFATRYMRLFAHLPLLHLDDPQSALIICFGVGNTAHAASLHPLERIEVVDLSRHVLEHASYFEASNQNVLDDPRVDVYIQDGRTHLRMQPDASYDLITLEPPPIRFAGVSSLYSVEFYELARQKLSDDGFVTQWLPAYQVPANINLSIVRSFLEVFPDAMLVSGAASELILVGQKSGAPRIELDELNHRIRTRPGVREDLPRIAVENPTDFIGLFAASAKTLDEATRDARPVTDDYPIMEYAGISGVRDGEIPTGLFAVQEVSSWCPRCWSDGQPDRRIEHIDRYLAIMQAYYDSPSFLRYRAGRREKAPLALPPGITLESPVVVESGLLRLIFGVDR